jgi:hypothetical protein
MKTIRLQLQGGLGNQLFIWAMAHELALANGARIKLIYVNDRIRRVDRPLELSDLSKNCEHPISLSQSKIYGLLFRMIDKFATRNRIMSTAISSIFGVYTCQSTYEIPDFGSRPPRILRGFFQDLRMVENNSQIMRTEIEKTLQSLPDMNSSRGSVILHIRRGDTRKISQSWGVLTDNYYLGIAKDSKKVVICTDDVTESENLSRKFPNAKILTSMDTTAWETLKILATAKELVMANSTLSWWAAWLLLTQFDSKVYFPAPWHPNEVEVFEKLAIPGSIPTVAEFE